MRKDHRSIRLIHILACIVIGLMTAGSGCDFSASGDAALKPPAPTPAEGIVRLPSDQVVSAGIEIHPVTRKEFRTHRDFPGTIAVSSTELICISTRGRDGLTYSPRTGSGLRISNLREFPLGWPCHAGRTCFLFAGWNLQPTRWLACGRASSLISLLLLLDPRWANDSPQTKSRCRDAGL